MNTVFFIDFDDTIYPTTHFDTINHTTQEKELNILSEKVISLVSTCSKHGKIYMVSNSEYKRMIDLIAKHYRGLIKLGVNFISSRDMYEKEFPKQHHLWKKLTFRLIISNEYSNKNKINNIISIGDDMAEHYAVRNLKNYYSDIYIKSLILQQNLNINQLSYVCDELKNNIDKIVKYEDDNSVFVKV